MPGPLAAFVFISVLLPDVPPASTTAVAASTRRFGSGVAKNQNSEVEVHRIPAAWPRMATVGPGRCSSIPLHTSLTRSRPWSPDSLLPISCIWGLYYLGSKTRERERQRELAEEAGKGTVAKRKTAIVAKGTSKRTLLCVRGTLWPFLWLPIAGSAAILSGQR